MLDCADRDAGIVAEHGTQCQIFDVGDVGGDLSDNTATLGDEKAEASVGSCWVQYDRDWRSAVHPRARQLDLTRNCRLSRADKPIRHDKASLDARWR